MVAKPEGLIKHGKNNVNLVRCLHKALHGLRQAPRAWNGRIYKRLVNNDCTDSTTDPCLYIRTDDLIFPVLYLDDILTAGEGLVATEDMNRMLMGQLSMADLVWANVFVGIQVVREIKMG